jgi:CelD/BcsL family acetyltransferase involved in cellulose biosynthesis
MFYEYLAGGEGDFDVDLSAIRDGDKCVSCLLGVMKNGVYYALDTAFDGAYAQYSPGYLILWFTIQTLFEEDVMTFDYGIEHAYKHRYGFADYESCMLVLFRNRGIAAASRLWKLSKAMAQTGVREVAPLFGYAGQSSEIRSSRDRGPLSANQLVCGTKGGK